MGKIEVKFFASFRDQAGTSLTETEADTIEELIDKLTEEFEGLQEALLDEDGPEIKLKGGVTMTINGRNIRFLEGLSTKLTEGDTVAIFPPIAGG